MTPPRSVSICASAKWLSKREALLNWPGSTEVLSLKGAVTTGTLPRELELLAGMVLFEARLMG